MTISGVVGIRQELTRRAASNEAALLDSDYLVGEP
jgi:hypothetical protein